jgi:hypothetical protein
VNDYKELNLEATDYKSSFEISFDNYGFLAIILLFILSVFMYSLLIRKLKARPE